MTRLRRAPRTVAGLGLRVLLDGRPAVWLHRVSPALATLLALAALPASADDTSALPSTAQPGTEFRLRWDASSANPQGPLAAAHALWPAIAAPTPSAAVAEVELRQTLRGQALGQPLALAVNLLAWHEQPEARTGHSQARVNELSASTEAGPWSLSAGKKILGWDVGYGFRPNDFVQQEQRRTLLSVTPEGRPLLQAEHFGADSASTVLWVNPQQLHATDDRSRGAQESALALRHCQRRGAADGFVFGRLAQRTGASLGAALAWVASDSLELHASARALQRHDGWQLAPAAADRPLPGNPWQQTTLGPAQQWLLGGQWTGAAQQSLLVEAWHDSSTLSDDQWSVWARRNTALAGSPTPTMARAANLAWQATPLNTPNLRRDTLFVRLAWQPERWLLSLDALLQPADQGHSLTAALQWQGERLRLNASLRVYGGPANALLRQLPQQRVGVLAAHWAY